MKRTLCLAAAGLVFSAGLVFAADTAAVRHDKQVKAPRAEKKAEPGLCPVMKGKASTKYSYSYKGTTYYFCCPGCIDDFKKNPGKYTGQPVKKTR